MLQSAAYAPEKKASTLQREAFFLDFAKIIRERFPTLVLIVTGGFRTRGAMEDAIASGACDLIGLARPAAVVPCLPKDVILNEEVEDSEAQIWLKPIPLPAILKMLPLKGLSAGIETVRISSLNVLTHIVRVEGVMTDAVFKAILQQADSADGPGVVAYVAIMTCAS